MTSKSNTNTLQKGKYECYLGVYSIKFREAYIIYQHYQILKSVEKQPYLYNQRFFYLLFSNKNWNFNLLKEVISLLSVKTKGFSMSFVRPFYINRNLSVVYPKIVNLAKEVLQVDHAFLIIDATLIYF